MKLEAFEAARDAMSSLEFYRNHYGSTPKYVEHRDQIVAMLRQRAENKPADGGRFLNAFANALGEI